MIRLWVDDIREPPGRTGSKEDFWWARTYNEATRFLSMYMADVICLDHDLGGEKTGYDLLCWVERRLEYSSEVPPQIFCHSMNPVGRSKIQVAIDRINSRFGGRRK